MKNLQDLHQLKYIPLNKAAEIVDIQFIYCVPTGLFRVT